MNSLYVNLTVTFCFICRGYYIVIVPLIKKSDGKFMKPRENPDEMELDEVPFVYFSSFSQRNLF